MTFKSIHLDEYSHKKRVAPAVARAQGTRGSILYPIALKETTKWF